MSKVQYPAIADAAMAAIGVPYTGDPAARQALIIQAYEALKAETTTQPKDVVRINPRDLAASLGFATASSIIAKLKALGGDLMADLLDSAEGLDLKHPESQSVLSAWHDNTDPAKLSDAEYNALIGLTADEVVSKWPKIQPGHVQNALEWRLAGRV